MAFWRLIGWDFVMLWRSSAAAATILVLFAAAGLASYTGLAQQSAHREALSQAEATAAQNAAPAVLQSPHSVRLRIVVDEPPLIDFASGRAGLDPILGEATPLTPLHRVFENYQVDNPVQLALARFDYVFLLTVVAPLVLIALTAGLLGEERRTGRLALLIAQDATPGRIVLARVMARALLVALPLAAALWLQASFGGGIGGERGVAFAVFVAAAALGLLIWAGLCVLVNSLVKSGAAAAAALFATWLILAAAGPSAISAGAQSIAASPSRLALLADARAAEIAALQSAETLAQAYLNDHPELERGDFDVPAWAKSRYVVAQSIDAAVAPLRREFEASLSRQIAFAQALQGLSPTLAQTIAMTETADVGASAALRRSAEAQAQTSAFREAMGAYLMGARGVWPTEAAVWSEMRLTAASPVPWTSLGWLSLWAAAVWIGAAAALRRGGE
jgi:ABC-2 type transport system permease protein